MGWVIGHGNSFIFRQGSGKQGQSYWATRYVSGLIVTTISDTQIDGTFDIYGTGQDGTKIYISTDGINYTLNQTLIAADNEFQATGLNPGTYYYFKAVPYKGSYEGNPSNADFVKTLHNSALINGWEMKQENNDAFINSFADNPWIGTNHPSAIYRNGVTYIAYSGNSDDAYVISYNHASGLFSSPVLVGANPLADNDDHGTPSMLIDANGYIHIFWGCHNSDLQYAKSTNPEDISAWTAMTSPVSDPEDCTYPQPMQMSNGDIWLFFRSIGTASSYWSYKISSDGGSTWGEAVNFARDIAYWVFVKGVGDTIHAVGFGNNQTSLTRKNVYYIFHNGTNWINISGDIQPSPIVLADNNCTAYNSGNYYTPIAYINVTTDNKPVIMFAHTVAELDLTYLDQKVLKHNGTAWEIFNIGNRTEFNQAYRFIFDLISDTIYHAYLLTGSLSPSFSGDVIKWISNDAGETWQRLQLIKEGCINDLIKVDNYNNDAKIVLSTYSENNSGFSNTGYLWGDNGFIGSLNSIAVPSIRGGNIGIKNSTLSLAVGGGYEFTGTPKDIILYRNNCFSFDDGSPDAPFSITMKIKVNNTTNTQHLFVKNDATSLREYYINIELNLIRFLCITPTNLNYILASAPYTSNDEVFVCCTYDGGGVETGLKIYLDLVEAQTSQTETGTYPGMTNVASNIRIGSYRGTSNWFVGNMKELKVWNKVLTPTEMSNIMNEVAGW